MSDLFKKDKLIWEAKIRKVGIKYEEVNNIKLPEYRIKFIEDTENIKYSMQILNSTKPITLNVNIGFMLTKSFDYVSTLFHEFTHLCDYSFLLLDKNEKYRKTALPLFAELHADFIRGLYLHSKSNTEGINEHILESISLIKESISEYNKEMNVVNFHSIINAYMYYYGSLIAFNESNHQTVEVKSFNFKYDNLIHQFYIIASFKHFDEKMLDISYKLQFILDENLKNDLTATY